MTRLRRFLTAALFAALFLVGSRALVRGPEGADVPRAVPLPQQAALLSGESQEAEPLAQRQLAEHSPQRAALPAAEREAILPPDVSSGSLWQVTGRTWARSAYTLCPPEGSPG